MTVIQSSVVIDKNEDGSDITQDVDVLVWWRDVGQTRFPHIDVMTRQFLTIPLPLSFLFLFLPTLNVSITYTILQNILDSSVPSSRDLCRSESVRPRIRKFLNKHSSNGYEHTIRRSDLAGELLNRLEPVPVNHFTV